MPSCEDTKCYYHNRSEPQSCTISECKLVYEANIGKQVSKCATRRGRSVKTGNVKAFKSGEKINTVRGVINHPILNVPAYTFVEDESYVECCRCLVVDSPVTEKTNEQCDGSILNCMSADGDCMKCGVNPYSIHGAAVRLLEAGTMVPTNEFMRGTILPKELVTAHIQGLCDRNEQQIAQIEKLTTVALYYIKEMGIDNPPVYLARDLAGGYDHIQGVVRSRSIDWDMDVLKKE